MKPSGYYTSGEFARMANVSIRTIRFYDKQNILKPSYVSPPAPDSIRKGTLPGFSRSCS